MNCTQEITVLLCKHCALTCYTFLLCKHVYARAHSAHKMVHKMAFYSCFNYLQIKTIHHSYLSTVRQRQTSL